LEMTEMVVMTPASAPATVTTGVASFNWSRNEGASWARERARKTARTRSTG
jgi:hypothetical protein